MPERLVVHPRADALARRPLRQTADEDRQHARRGQIVERRHDAHAVMARHGRRRKHRAEHRAIEQEAAHARIEHAQRAELHEEKAKAHQTEQQPCAHKRRRDAEDRQPQRLHMPDASNGTAADRASCLCTQLRAEQQHGEERGQRHADSIDRHAERKCVFHDDASAHFATPEQKYTMSDTCRFLLVDSALILPPSNTMDVEPPPSRL